MKKSLFYFLFSPSVDCGMSQSCLIASNLHIRPKVCYISYFFLFSWASTKAISLHFLAFIFLLLPIPGLFQGGTTSFPLSLQPCLLDIRYVIVTTVKGSSTCSHRRCFSTYAQAFSITFNILELRVGRNGRSLKDSMGKPLFSPSSRRYSQLDNFHKHWPHYGDRLLH